MAVTAALVVRPLELRDAPAVLSLAGSLGDWFNAEGLARIAEDLGRRAGYVAVRAGRVVGFLLWSQIDRETADLAWMGVALDLQRRGIGTALLDAAAGDLRAAGFRALEVSTVADNVDYAPYKRTRRFYRSRGFADLRVDPRYWGSGEDRYDRLVLRLDLSSPADGRAYKHRRCGAERRPGSGASPGGF